MLIRARRPFDIGGRSVVAGEIIDLATIDLPPGRAQTLVNARLGEYVTEADNSSQSATCDVCDRSFSSMRALGIHKGRAHSGMTEE